MSHIHIPDLSALLKSPSQPQRSKSKYDSQSHLDFDPEPSDLETVASTSCSMQSEAQLISEETNIFASFLFCKVLRMLQPKHN